MTNIYIGNYVEQDRWTTVMNTMNGKGGNQKQ